MGKGKGGRKNNGQQNNKNGDNFNAMRQAFHRREKRRQRREQILADRLRLAAKWQPKIPEVRKTNFENFKNRFVRVGKPDYAIYALMGGSGAQEHIQREQALRDREESRKRSLWFGPLGDPLFGGIKPNKPKKVKALDAYALEKRNEIPEAHDQVQRIRIQSQPVLGHLTSLLNTTKNKSTFRTFVRPFKPLVYFQPKMKEILATLEEKWGDFEDLDDQESDTVDIPTPAEAETEANTDSRQEGELERDAIFNDDDDDDDDEDALSDSDTESLSSVESDADDDFSAVMDSPEALKDMRCYVKFIDEEVMPLYHHFDGSKADTVRFEDLWYLFRPGDLVCAPQPEMPGGRYHEVWRVYKTKVPEPKNSAPMPQWSIFAADNQSDDNGKFEVRGYHVDHNGTAYGAVKRNFIMEPYSGERAIDSLEFFPVRYRPDYEQFMESLKDQGRRFLQYMDDRHQQYNAWTLTKNPPWKKSLPEKETLKDTDGVLMHHPEFIESDVIIDFKEACQKMPSWRPDFHQVRLDKKIRCTTAKDVMPVQNWFDQERQKKAYMQSEELQKDDGVEHRQCREYLFQDNFLYNRLKGTRTFKSDSDLMKLRDQDVLLLPKRMFSYALRERRFLPVDLTLLKPVPYEADVFDNLRIHQDYKDIVRGLVMSHFQKKALERQYADAARGGPSQDLIQGKGRGLVVLLHGAPGVGKTATAEAVAMENKKPLFVITCGDLGLTPKDVEASLKNVFRLAHLWDCVLLLDEADVFLSQRNNSSIQRNALVSVFLRVLEYYNGLLFLTTNRVGSIDAAFQSRIHMSLYYPPLDKTQTRDIFRLNLAKLKKIEAERSRMTGEPALIMKDGEILDFAAKHYDDLGRSTGCWNGRQIRSAFQIASGLAVNKYNNDVEAAKARGDVPPAAPLLDRSSFDKVQMSTQSFDRHMKSEAGKRDDTLEHRATFDGGD